MNFFPWPFEVESGSGEGSGDFFEGGFDERFAFIDLEDACFDEENASDHSDHQSHGKSDFGLFMEAPHK